MSSIDPKELPLYTPKEIAEKIDVAPNMVYVYSKEFEEELRDYTSFTKGTNGHRRYTEQGLAVFFEIRRMLDLPNYTYQRVHEEFRRRKEENLGGPAAVVQYESLKKLEQLYGADGAIVKQMYAIVNAFGELAERNKSLERQNQEVIEKFNEQSRYVHELSTSNAEISKKADVLIDSFGDLAKKYDGLEEANQQLLSTIDSQNQNIASLQKKLEEVPLIIQMDNAKNELEVLEESGKGGFFSRLFGKRDTELENRRRERLRQIIESDRVALKNTGPEVNINYSSNRAELDREKNHTKS